MCTNCKGVPEDYPNIVCAIASTLGSDFVFDSADEVIIEAAHLFAEKGTPPRTIRSSLSVEASLRDGPLTPQRVLHAATQVLPLSRRALLSAEYADLAAIAQCTTSEFLPWAAVPATFPFPSYLKVIVDPATGSVNRAALEARMAELSEVIDV